MKPRNLSLATLKRRLRRARSYQVILVGAVIVLLLTPLAWLSFQLSLQRTDFAQALSAVRELKRVDAAWNADSLRLSSGLLSDYDPLSHPLALVRAQAGLLQSLVDKARSQDVGPWSAQLPALMSRYQAALSRKTEVLERIKSQQSILRNSAHFLPIACAQLAGSIGALPNEDRRSSLAVLDGLLVDTMSYLREVRPDTRLRLEQSISRLEGLAQHWAPTQRDEALAVATHTRLVVEQRRSGDLLLRELLALPTAASLDSINDAFERGQAAFRQAQDRSKTLLAIYVALLLASLGVAGWLLARSYADLNVSNEKLRQANEATQIQLIQSAKMAAMGRMAAGVAHEINTPLAYVKATLEVLKERLIDRREANSGIEELAELFGDGLYGIEQISTLVLTLKNFSRLDLARVTQFSVEEGLDSSLLLARYTLKHVAEVRKEYAGVPRISCSPAQLNQVFLNIILNAAHAMGSREGKGILTVRTAVEGDFVRVDIEDNGTGIPKDVLPRIFDPFFTTKRIGEGSGTGLAIAYRIVESHGGSIRVQTKEGVGTTFQVLLALHGSTEVQAQLKKVDSITV